MLTAFLALALVAQDSLHLRVLAMHDFHGALFARTFDWSEGRPIGGAAALKAYMDRRASECECLTLRMDGGDQMQGSFPSNLEFGAATVSALNAVGLSAAAIGNHEFDWGVDTLRARLADAEYHWLAANVHDSVTGRRPAWIQPHALIERDGLRVAVVGYVTASTKRIVLAGNTEGLVFGRGHPPIADVLEDVRQARPDFTIVVAHAAANCDATGCRGEMAELAAAAPAGSIDLIVSGHAHESGEAVVNGVPIVRSSSNARAIAVVDLIKLGIGGNRFHMAVDTIYADAIEPDSALTVELQALQRRTDSIASRPVALFAGPLSRRDRWLGNMIADVIRESASADVSLMNRGGVRRDFDAGPVTYGQVYELLPFNNEVVVLRLNGAELRGVIEYAILGGQPNHVSGLQVRYDRAADTIRSIVLDDGRPVRDDETYRFATSDFLAMGGDGYAMLVAHPFEGTGVTMRDALLSSLERQRGPLSGPRDVRVVNVGSRRR